MSEPMNRATILNMVYTMQADAVANAYAALAAENERLRSKLSFSQSISEICKQTHEGETITVQGSISSGKTDLSWLCQCERLAAENERLRSYINEIECIGDDLAGMVGHADVTGDAHQMMLELYDAWNAAKEGRDAK